ERLYLVKTYYGTVKPRKLIHDDPDGAITRGFEEFSTVLDIEDGRSPSDYQVGDGHEVTMRPNPGDFSRPAAISHFLGATGPIERKETLGVKVCLSCQQFSRWLMS